MQKIIELTEAIQDSKYRAQMLALRALLVAVSVVVLAHYVVLGTSFARRQIMSGYEYINRSIVRTEVVKELITADDIGLDELIVRTARGAGLNPIILKAIVLKESSGGATKLLYRFEPRVFAAREKLDFRFSDDERRMRASSHGITQVMGYRAEPDCGVHWSKLYDNVTALKCAATILKTNLAKTKGTPAQRLREAYRMYNGSGQDAENYADKIMGSVGELLFAQLKEEL